MLSLQFAITVRIAGIVYSHTGSDNPASWGELVHRSLLWVPRFPIATDGTGNDLRRLVFQHYIIPQSAPVCKFEGHMTRFRLLLMDSAQSLMVRKRRPAVSRQFGSAHHKRCWHHKPALALQAGE